jgi:hypothetical protein
MVVMPAVATVKYYDYVLNYGMGRTQIRVTESEKFGDLDEAKEWVEWLLGQLQQRRCKVISTDIKQTGYHVLNTMGI